MSAAPGCRCKVYLKDKAYDLNVACIRYHISMV